MPAWRRKGLGGDASRFRLVVLRPTSRSRNACLCWVGSFHSMLRSAVGRPSSPTSRGFVAAPTPVVSAAVDASAIELIKMIKGREGEERESLFRSSMLTSPRNRSTCCSVASSCRGVPGAAGQRGLGREGLAGFLREAEVGARLWTGRKWRPRPIGSGRSVFAATGESRPLMPGRMGGSAADWGSGFAGRIEVRESATGRRNWPEAVKAGLFGRASSRGRW